MAGWIALSLAYSMYLAVLAWSRPRFGRARRPALLALAVAAALGLLWPRPGAVNTALDIALHVVVPSLALIGVYHFSGFFFVAPMASLERRLLALDDTLLVGTGVLRAYGSAPRAFREVVELSYLLVYLVVPAGALTVALGESPRLVDRYWTAIFATELACYAALPWLQTRPPRTLESAAGAGAADAARRLNLTLLRLSSIQVNTIPSGHAAGAFAVALAVAAAAPAWAAVYLVAATAITVATVLGRYHYLADSVLGVAVAFAVASVAAMV